MGTPDFFENPFPPTLNHHDTKAREWLAESPFGWEMMVAVTYELMKDGVPFSMKLVHEMLRHRFRVKSLGKWASNSCTPYFARLLCAWEPKFSGLLTGWKDEAEVFDALEDL